MTDALVIVAILRSNSILNILTWSFILGKAGVEVKSIFDRIQDTIQVIKGE